MCALSYRNYVLLFIGQLPSWVIPIQWSISISILPRTAKGWLMQLALYLSIALPRPIRLPLLTTTSLLVAALDGVRLANVTSLTKMFTPTLLKT